VREYIVYKSSPDFAKYYFIPQNKKAGAPPTGTPANYQMTDNKSE